MFAQDPNKIFIIGENPDRPIKVCIGEPIETKEESNIIPEYKRLTATLKQMSRNKLITAQQYRSVKGQIKKGYYTIVHQFLIKNNYYDYFLSLPVIEDCMVWYTRIGMDIYRNKKFGVYTWKDGE